MNKSSLLLLIMGLLLVLGSAILYASGDHAALAAPSMTAIAEEAFTPRSTGSVVEAAGEEASFVDYSEDLGDEIERTEVEIEIDQPGRFTIQVWDRKRGVVAAEAAVFVLEGYREPEMRDLFRPHKCELAIAKGQRYRASTEGRVELPRLQDGAIVAATLPGASGMVSVRKGHSEVVSVLIRAEETVTVRVVDQVGRPLANVPVGILQQIPERGKRGSSLQWLLKLEGSKQGQANQKAGARVQAGGRSVAQPRQVDIQRLSDGAKSPTIVASSMKLQTRRRSDAKGLAVFKHFHLYRQEAAQWWPEKYSSSFEAVLMVPLAAPARAGFRGKPVPKDVVELRMPPTGSVALRTIDRDGRPFTHPVRGELRVVDRENSSWGRTPIRKLQNERELVFPYVGVGVQLDAFCRLDDNDFKWRMPEIAGPREAGERVVADLVVAPSAAMLYGRLLDAAGAALVDVKTTFLINSVLGRLEGEEVALDNEGRFHLPYKLSARHQAPWRLQVRYQGRMPVPGLATTLATLPKEGVLDVGDLQIGELAQITYGRVVNDLGEAVSGARVQLQRERERQSGRGRRISWQDEAFTVASTDEAGNFSLFGDLEAGNYRLRITADEHFAYQQPGLPSRDGVVIELLRRSRVVGSLLMPRWLASRSVKVRLQCHAKPSDSKDAKVVDYRGKKMIYFDWVRPGIYSLSLRLEEFPDAFVTVSNFEVKAGQRDEHPRLKGLEVGRGLFRYEVFAVDGSGKKIDPKSPLRARVMRPDGRYALVAFYWKRGRAEIISAQSSIEVMPEESGYRAASQTLIAGRNEVQFRRVSPVIVHAPGMRQLVGSESVWISLDPIDKHFVESFDSRSRRVSRSITRASSSYAQLSNRDKASLKPIRDGRYRVVARLGSKRRSGLTKLTLGEVMVRAREGGAPVELKVAVDSQAVIAAMEIVAQKRAAPPSLWSATRR